MFKVTENAVQQIRKALQQTGEQNLALRIAARFAADKSIEYMMGFDELGQHDEPIHYDEVTIVINADSQELLEDATLDFVELEPGNQQFIFMNPLDPTYVPPQTDHDTTG